MKFLKKPKLTLAIIAVIGSLSAWALINLALIKINLFEYFVIEIIITVLHLLYNKAKKDLIPQS
jgi:UDP-N-acetylmuramyl pentapeptide phosphotransferase/UDP-N-acetylglucosamine-1-phosphate transferase